MYPADSSLAQEMIARQKDIYGRVPRQAASSRPTAGFTIKPATGQRLFVTWYNTEHLRSASQEICSIVHQSRDFRAAARGELSLVNALASGWQRYTGL